MWYVIWNAYVDPWDMLINFCFRVYAQKSMFIGENGNVLAALQTYKKVPMSAHEDELQQKILCMYVVCMYIFQICVNSSSYNVVHMVKIT